MGARENWFVLLLSSLILMACSPEPVNPNGELSPQSVESAWDAGAVIISTRESYGQGYLVQMGDDVFIATIQHVIRGYDTVWISIPGLTQDSEVKTSRFVCESSGGDPACLMEVNSETAQLILRGEFPVIPYYRGQIEVHVGDLVSSPRPDTRKWTIYRVTEIYDDSLVIEAEGAGNFCHGRSGGPVVLIRRTSEGIVLPTYNGNPISLGELQKGFGNSHEDIVGTGNRCYMTVVINRPQPN